MAIREFLSVMRLDPRNRQNWLPKNNGSSKNNGFLRNLVLLEKNNGSEKRLHKNKSKKAAYEKYDPDADPKRIERVHILADLRRDSPETFEERVYKGRAYDSQRQAEALKMLIHDHKLWLMKKEKKFEEMKGVAEEPEIEKMEKLIRESKRIIKGMERDLDVAEGRRKDLRQKASDDALEADMKTENNCRAPVERKETVDNKA